jgi:hypothetical protein
MVHDAEIGRITQTGDVCQKAAFENGATLLGDERSGRFSHDMAKGEYRMAGRTVIVTITEKHWLLPWPVMEARLRELIR